MSAKRVWTPERLEGLRAMCARMNDNQVAQALSLPRAAIEKARRRYGIKSGYVPGSDSRKPPEGFADIAHTLTFAEVVKRYGCARKTARKWFELVGAKSAGQTYKKKIEEEPKKVASTYKRGFGLGPGFGIPARDWSLAASAQLTLQRHMPCFRAKTAYPNAPDDQWVVGNIRVSESEMIQKAERYGFKVAA